MASAPSIEKIVARVKCDLVNAVSAPLEDPKNTWLQTWTAQVSLNFIVSDQANITPGATFIQPLKTESIPLRVTNAPRSWNLGVGAGFDTTASRNETLTFSMSLREVYDALHTGQVPFGCDKVNTWDLHSELGIKDWIANSLGPVNDGFLESGHHKTSKAAQAPASSKGGPPAGAGAAGSFSIEAFIPKPKEKKAGTWPPYCTNPPNLTANLGADLRAIAPYEIDDNSTGTAKQVIAYVDKRLASIIDKALRDTRAIIAEVRAQATPDLKCMQWAKSVEDALLQLELDPPIDVLADQIQFVIAYNASVSPSWTLVHFKGPSPTSTLFSGTKTLTHTLNITIGPPSSPDAANTLSALLTSTAITQSLNASGIRVAPF